MDNFIKRKYVSPELVLVLLEKECVLSASTTEHEKGIDLPMIFR